MTSTKKQVSVGEREEYGGTDGDALMLGATDGAADCDGCVDSLGDWDEDCDWDGNEDRIALGEGEGAADGVCVGMSWRHLSMLSEYTPVLSTPSRFRPER